MIVPINKSENSLRCYNNSVLGEVVNFKDNCFFSNSSRYWIREKGFFIEKKLIGYPFDIDFLISNDLLGFLKGKGVYFLFKNEDLVYIGMSNFIGRRLIQHFNSEKEFTHCLWSFSDNSLSYIRNLESILIRTFNPIYNIRN